MENVADALKMAGAVLLFVLALSIIIFYFGQVRESADTILNYRDRETAYIEGNYYYQETDGTTRTVGLDTIIPSVFRAYLENYTIVFDGLDKPIYKIKNTDGEFVDKYILDLESNITNNYIYAVLGSEDQKARFIKGILYGSYENTKDEFEKEFFIKLEGCSSLYDQLTSISGDKVVREYLGEYYQNYNENDNVNSIKKRIITYRIESKQ